MISITSCFSIGSASAQAVDATPAAAEANSKPTPAEEFLDRVRQELPKRRTVKADIVQVVAIGDQRFKIEGTYLSSANTAATEHPIPKLRLQYHVIPDQGIQGEMLEICDGRDLWTELKLPDSKQSPTESLRVTRRNVQQILSAAIAANQQNLPAARFNVELGLGGISALLASLERTMTFDAMKEEQVEGRTRTIIQGRWKKELLARFRKEKDDSLPAFVPDLVRLVVNNETLFPERLYYLKKQPQKKTFKPLISLEFKNVEFDSPVDDIAFEYKLPPGEIVPEDVTKQYVDRMTAPPAAPGAAATR